jgi:hemolysin III
MITDISLAQYSKTEEIANWITHAVALLLSITALVLMVVYSTRFGNVYHIVSSAVFGTTLILLYSASTLYHLVPVGRAKNVFQKLDHAMIYLLIAGTYTPYTLVNLRGPWGWSIFAVVWGLALTGLLLELIMKKRLGWLSVSLYLFLGWIIVIAVKPLMANLAAGGIVLLVAGGLFYSLGVIFYLWKRLPFQHAIWHLFVIAGSLCHFFSIFLYVIPAS